MEVHGNSESISVGPYSCHEHSPMRAWMLLIVGHVSFKTAGRKQERCILHIQTCMLAMISMGCFAALRATLDTVHHCFLAKLHQFKGSGLMPTNKFV